MQREKKNLRGSMKLRVGLLLLVGVAPPVAAPLFAQEAVNQNKKQDSTGETKAKRDAARFTAVMKRTVADDQPELGGEFLIDLDTGKLESPPAELLQADFQTAIRWMKDHGFDAIGEGGDDGLVGVDMIVRQIDKGPIAEKFPDFPEETTQGALEALARDGAPGTPVSLDAKAGVGSKATYLFRTREGAMGVIQIIGWDIASQAVDVHYRLLRSSVREAPQP